MKTLTPERIQGFANLPGVDAAVLTPFLRIIRPSLPAEAAIGELEYVSYMGKWNEATIKAAKAGINEAMRR